MGVVSKIVYRFSQLMIHWAVVSPPIGNVILIFSYVPLIVNMVSVLIKSYSEDKATAVFKAATGNIIGVFLTPFLILRYLGVKKTHQ